MRVHILPALGDNDVQDITREVLQKYVEDKQKHGSPIRHPQGLKPATIICHFHIIKPSLDLAVEKGMIAKNPCSEVNLPKIEDREVSVFKNQDAKRLISFARPKWFGDIILLAYHTGMRRGELYGLQWNDVDFSDKFLMVRRSIEAYAPKQFLIHPPKTRRSRRRIDLDDLSLEMLARRLKIAKSKWVFENQHGKPISPWYTTKYMAAACDAAGVPRRCFHTLRHSHATYLLSKGINPKIVQERLGHAHVSTTLEIYSHVLPTMQKVAVAAMNNLS